jgi:hypothetical protein
MPILRAIVLILMLCATTHAATVADECDALAAKWKDRFDSEKFTTVVAPPFVIAGDAPKAKLERYRDRTILAAATALQKIYFDTPPSEPILILLFESAGPYERLSKEWFGYEEVPHYGFYAHTKRLMLMNVGTGTGTLVHELTHALIAPDFPNVPDWFNEGLASLYEQCSLGVGNATITGHENWRLPSLQKAIHEKKLRSLEEMISANDFRDEEMVGINYAQARYLMFFLQEKKLLAKFYETFRNNVNDDPLGLETLKDLVGPQSLAEFEKDWRAWVLTLKFE